MSRRFQLNGQRPTHLNASKACRGDRVGKHQPVPVTPKTEADDGGLRRFLRVDPAIEETMRKAGI
jgi:hypothetical protein